MNSASDGERAIDLFYSNNYDLIILDLNIPRLYGMDVLKEIRVDNKEVPILILSAKSEVSDKIEGLDRGGK